MKLTRTLGLLIPVLALSMTTGCDEESSSPRFGDLQVTYRVGSGTNSCADVGIQFVRVFLLDRDGEPEMDELFSCDASDQTVIVEEVTVGSYTVRVEGLNSNNATIYTGESTREIEVEADQTNGPVSVVLNQLRPAIQMWFGFAEAGGCERFEVVDFVIRLYENGASLVFDQTFPCSEQITESLLVEDLSETSTYDLRARGTNANGEYTHAFDTDGISVSAGEPTQVSVEFDECSGLCSEP